MKFVFAFCLSLGMLISSAVQADAAAGQSTYAASCGSGFYAPTLVSLGTPPTVAGGDGFIGTDLATDPSVKSSYTITQTGGAAAAGLAWYASTTIGQS